MDELPEASETALKWDEFNPSTLESLRFSRNKIICELSSLFAELSSIFPEIDEHEDEHEEKEEDAPHSAQGATLYYGTKSFIVDYNTDNNAPVYELKSDACTSTTSAASPTNASICS